MSYRTSERVTQVFERSCLKILNPKQMLQRLPIEFAQVKVSNLSEDILNEMHQIMYSLFRAKEITKKVYNSIINSAKL